MERAVGKREVALVGLLFAAAGGLRFACLSSVPRWLIPDELSNAYDAYSLWQTGADRWGRSWPMVLEAFGRRDYRSASYTYLLLPFVAVAGPEHLVTVARVPAALCGLFTIACLYWLVRRVDDRRTALAAALLLALSPWHVFLSRYGAEPSLAPLFPPLVLLALSLAGWPLRGERAEPAAEVRLRRLPMASFGLVLGLSCYAYAALRVFMPLWLVAGALIYRRVWPQIFRSRENRRALLVGLAVLAATAAPLVWLTMTEWDKVHARAVDVSVFSRSGSTADALWQGVRNWAAHFGPTWLFVHGPDTALGRTLGVGQINWYMLLLLPAGLAVTWRESRRNRVYAMLLAWLVLHPVASALTHDAPQPMRASCGLGSFQWVGAIGLVGVISWAQRRGRSYRPIVLLLALGVTVNTAWWLTRYYRVFGSDVRLSHLFQADLRDALHSIRDRWQRYDRVFISDHYAPQRYWMSDFPYIYVLVDLRIEPARFHAWDKQVIYDPPDAPWHKVLRMGPFTLSTRPDVLHEYFQGRRDGPVLIIARPGDVSGGRVLETIPDPRGEPRFEISEVLPP